MFPFSISCDAELNETHILYRCFDGKRFAQRRNRFDSAGEQALVMTGGKRAKNVPLTQYIHSLRPLVNSCPSDVARACVDRRMRWSTFAGSVIGVVVLLRDLAKPTRWAGSFVALRGVRYVHARTTGVVRDVLLRVFEVSLSFRFASRSDGDARGFVRLAYSVC